MLSIAEFQDQWSRAGSSSGVFLVAVAGLCGLFFWISLRRLKRRLDELNQRSDVHSPSAARGPQANVVPQDASIGERRAMLFDPVRTHEAIYKAIEKLCRRPTFPTLFDLATLDDIAESDPALLGALLLEFPAKIQRRLFGYSFHPGWLEALSSPGELRMELLEVLQRMLRQNEEHSPEMERVLSEVWRLDHRRSELMRLLKPQEVVSLLCALPKSVAIPVAREVLPGKWEFLLDSTLIPKPVEPQRWMEIQGLALQLQPHRDFALTIKYRREKELIAYLRTASLEEEREIYQISGRGSLLHALRSPFYSILELSGDELEGFVNSVEVEEWACALTDIENAESHTVERSLNSTRREDLKRHAQRLAQSPPSIREIGAARERIAKAYHAHQNRRISAYAELHNDPTAARESKAS